MTRRRLITAAGALPAALAAEENGVAVGKPTLSEIGAAIHTAALVAQPTASGLAEFLDALAAYCEAPKTHTLELLVSGESYTARVLVDANRKRERSSDVAV